MRDTQKAALPHLRALRVEDRDEALQIDAATRRNLELDRRQRRARGCEPARAARHDHDGHGLAGAAAPAEPADHRPGHAAPAATRRSARSAEGRRFEPLREVLRGVGDIERILSRVALRSARPRDLAGLRLSLAQLPAVRGALARFDSPLLQA